MTDNDSYHRLQSQIVKLPVRNVESFKFFLELLKKE